MEPGTATAASTKTDLPQRTGSWREVVPGVIIIVALGHFVVDILASQMLPVWPALGRNLSLDLHELRWVIILWTSTMSFMQVVFGYLSDRVRLNQLIWIGPGVAALSLSMVPLTHSVLLACVLIMIGGTAIAAFHPEAVAMCGAAMPANRSRAIALFVVGGFLGQTTGPLYAGSIVRSWGISGLSCGALWGLAAALVLALAMRGRWGVTSVSTGSAPDKPPPAQPPWLMLVWILAIQTLRVVSAVGVPLALAFLLDARGIGAFQIGLQQCIFNGGIGLGGFVCAVFLQPQQERRALIWLPIAGVLPFSLLTVTSGWATTACIASAAFTVGMAMPVMISYGQRLVPTARRLASSLVMGASWGIGGCVATALASSVVDWPHPEFIFVALAISSLGAGLLSVGLPEASGS